MNTSLPVAIIGAGPVGLSAAAHLLERGLDTIILEQGPGVATAALDWGHVGLFSPWRYNIDAAARRLLEAHGWQAPDDDMLPTGAELAERYLLPLAKLPDIEKRLRLNSKVTAISRDGLNKVSTTGRADTHFVIRYSVHDGEEKELLAGAVIDASGTWASPNPMGVNGLTVSGETQLGEWIDYGIPDVAGARRADFAGRRVLVVGGGHSAINAVLDLMRLQQDYAETKIVWALRRDNIKRLLGGGLNDQLPARGDLGLAAQDAINAGRVQILAPFSTKRVSRNNDHLIVEARHKGEDMELRVDRVIVATGLRPDISFLRELRISLDPAVEAPPALAPLIDPNLHSCGTVPPHGVDELTHPEAGFYIVGSKSYGRAPTFLMATGYEQVRSIAAELAGDPAEARQVHLVLPETGVCNASPEPSADGQSKGCCGGPAVALENACCKRDEDVKNAGGEGCGCGSKNTVSEDEKRSEPA